MMMTSYDDRLAAFVRAAARGQRLAALARCPQLVAARPPAATWDVVPAHGGWSAVLRISREPGEEATCLALLDAGVLVQPGYFYDFSGGAFLVLSLLPPPELFASALGPLARALEG